MGVTFRRRHRWPHSSSVVTGNSGVKELKKKKKKLSHKWADRSPSLQVTGVFGSFTGCKMRQIRCRNSAVNN